MLYSMAFLFIIGITWGELVVQASFLFKRGVENLPQVIAANAIVSIIAIAVYTLFVDRVANDKLVIGISITCAASIGVGYTLLELSLSDAAYSLLYVLAIVIRQAFNLQWWTYVNSFYDTRAAKRIIPILVTAARVAVIIAGQTMPILNKLLLPRHVILVWASTLIAVALLTWLMPYLLKQTPAAATRSSTRASEQRASFIQNIREGYRHVSQSSFLRWMALSTLLMMLLFALIEYHASDIFIRIGNFASKEELSSALGRWSSWASLILLPFQLFVFSHLVGRIGLGNANLIFPIGSLVICGALITRPQLGSAFMGYLDRQIFRTVFRNPTDNLLYNAVPLRVKGRARAFIGGLVVPIGSLIGSGLLLLAQITAVGWLLPALIGVTVAAYAISAIFVRKKYTQALIAMLEQEDFSFLLSLPSDLAVTDETTLNWLTKKLEGASSELVIFIAKLISEVGGSKTIPILGPVVRSGDPRVRSTILDVLAAADARGKAAGELYTEFVTDPDGRVRRSAIAALERWAGPRSEQFLSLALELLQDPDVDVRAQVIPPLIQSGDFFYVISASQALTQLLEHENPDRQARGVHILGQVGNARFIHNLTRYLTDSRDQVRLEAAIAIESLSRTPVPGPIVALVMEHAESLLNDPVERVRQAAVVTLGRLDTPDTHQALVRFLSDPSPQIRRAAVDALVEIGRSAIPTLASALDSADPQPGKMAAIALGRIDREQFGARITARVDDNLHTIYGNYNRVAGLSAYAQYASISVLTSLLREQNEQLAGEVFHLLTAIHEPEAVKVIAESISSKDTRVRANAVEALESLTTLQTTRLIAPIFDTKLTPAELAHIGQDTWNIYPPDAPQVIRQLVSDPDAPWLRAIGTLALGEMETARSRQATPALTSPEIETLLATSRADPVSDVRIAARTADRMIAGLHVSDVIPRGDKEHARKIGREETVLSTIERIIFLKEASLFRGLTVDNLKALANICEEEWYAKDTLVFEQEDPGGAMYIIVSGRVAIERAGQRKGSTLRLATLEANFCLGEMTLFDKGSRSAAARAIQDTLVLRLRRDPLVILLRQYPNMGMELIQVISQRLRDANDRIAQLTHSKPQELQNLYDRVL